jgi:hypothetical protein
VVEPPCESPPRSTLRIRLSCAPISLPSPLSPTSHPPPTPPHHAHRLPWLRRTERAAARNNVRELGTYLEAEHTGAFMVFNLAPFERGAQYNHMMLNRQVRDVRCEGGRDVREGTGSHAVVLDFEWQEDRTQSKTLSPVDHPCDVHISLSFRAFSLEMSSLSSTSLSMHTRALACRWSNGPYRSTVHRSAICWSYVWSSFLRFVSAVVLRSY